MLDMIRNRRSIRKYQDNPIPAEKLEIILRAAMQAPSARNTQPWEFVITEDRNILNRIPDFHPYTGMVPSAGAVILVCGTRSVSENRTLAFTTT